mgnify:CR=1 FL=1
MASRWVWKIVVACVLVTLVIGAYLYFIPQQAADFGNRSKYILIRRGEGIYEIAYKLRQMGAISSELNFVVFAKLPWNNKKIKAGRYAIEPGVSLAGIFRLLTSGAAVPYMITIPEGYTIAQIARLLSGQLELEAEEFIRACSDRELLDSLNISGETAEGYLYPDTYDFFYDEKPRAIIRKMVGRFFGSLPKDFEEKAGMAGLDPEEAVILASLIEKEAMIDSERPIISAVFHERLNRNMLLQCDPTVIYALGGNNKPLYYSDLQIDSPYNTYKYPGLPPGPICSPGSASLLAAVNPADVDYLYFVAKGDGSHIFSRTNDEHNIARNKVRKTKLLGIAP